MAKERIQYIDAMRGFTMFLVIFGHVSGFCLGISGTNTFYYHKIANQIQMPLFFFISGFVCYKSTSTWDFNNSYHFIVKKLSVLVLSPLIFMISLVEVKQGSIVDALYQYEKAGYWFTFALFEYFCFYIFSQQFVRLLKIKGVFKDIFFIGAGGIIYLATIWTFVIKYKLDSGWLSLIGAPTWHNFLFFIIGTRIRKHFAYFERWLDKKYTVVYIVSIFFIVNIFPFVSEFSTTLFQLITATTGILLVFALFRHNQQFFSEHSIGKVIQFVGQRTLDIYLIHYFFLYSNMQAVLPNFAKLNSPFLEFLCSSSIAICIMICSLGISCILRLSPVMAHFLFGQKVK